MLIPGRLIPKYFHTLEFPVIIYPETGDQTVYEATQSGLQQLIDAEAVVAFGSWKRIKKFRLNRPDNKLINLRLKLRHKLTADCNKTVIREHVGNQCAPVWRHHPGRSLGYLGRDPKSGDLDPTAL